MPTSETAVPENADNANEFEKRVHASEERLRLVEAASGVATFDLDLTSGNWNWSPQATSLFGLDAAALQDWQQTVFVDDLPKVRAAVEAAAQTGSFYTEFRVRHADRSLHWIAGRGQVTTSDTIPKSFLRGALYEITDRKALEARLLALNETLEARVAEARQETRALEVLNQVGVAVAAEHDLERLVQVVTDAGVELSHAEFGAFFYNILRDDGEAYTLYTLSGAPPEAFEKFPMPRNTAIFEPTFRGRPPVRSDDILADPRYGKSAPYHGMPSGHQPVRSYLAASVVSRSGEVLGGLFFGHAQPRVFTARAERIVEALAAQAAVAIDNARLHQANQQEITARTQAETDLQQLNQNLEKRAEKRAHQLAASLTKLEDTERRFQHLVEGVTDYAIYMLDIDGTVINWNPGAARIKGYSRDEIIGRHFSTFYTPEDLSRELPKSALRAALETGKYEAEGWRLRKDGSRFWASVVINAIHGADGRHLGFAKITRDLTERRAADERTRQAQKMEAIGHLTGGVAHDFNNLLMVIIGNLETIQRKLSDTPPDVERLQRSATNAMRGARRAESLTQRLLAFSRQQPLDPKPLDLGRVIPGMSDLLRRTLGEQVTVETVLGGGMWRALADPNQLEVAVLNLAVNARDAMLDGGKLTLETANVYLDDKYAATQAEVVPGQYVMLAVTDNGSGMTDEVKAKAFDPFFTTKDVGHGTGLGLSQVYGFIKQSRGHVKIYSELGEGTTIKLYLPRAHAISEEIEDDESKTLARGGKNEIVLVVEDDADVRAYSCETLSELGYDVLSAETGAAGLRLLDGNPGIRVLFTDVGLPGGMNGRQLAEEARKRRPDLKVLFTTGYARNAIVHDGRLDAGVDLITKPFSQARLAEKLRDIIDAKREPGRILLVEDETLIQMLAAEYLEGNGFTVHVAGSASEAMNTLGIVPGGVDAVVVDMGLPDRRGDALIREMRALHPSLPVVLATGADSNELRSLFKGEERIAFVTKPYTERELLMALSSLGLRLTKAKP
jgi:PAS domain S-box-containing protein